MICYLHLLKDSLTYSKVLCVKSTLLFILWYVINVPKQMQNANNKWMLNVVNCLRKVLYYLVVVVVKFKYSDLYVLFNSITKFPHLLHDKSSKVWTFYKKPWNKLLRSSSIYIFFEVVFHFFPFFLGRLPFFWRSSF